MRRHVPAFRTNSVAEGEGFSMWVIDEQIPLGRPGYFRVKVRCTGCGIKLVMGLYDFNHDKKGRRCMACYHGGVDTKLRKPFMPGMIFCELKLRKEVVTTYSDSKSKHGIARAPLWECECVHCGAVSKKTYNMPDLIRRQKGRPKRGLWHRKWCVLAER